MDITVLETPGHTPGSVCFYAEKEGILFSGDTLFFDGVGRTDLPGGSEKKLRESIQKKIAVLAPETRVFPGHGPFTTVEREKRGNVYFRGMVQEVRPVAAQRSPLVSTGSASGPQNPAKGSPAAAKKQQVKRSSPAAKKPLAKAATGKRPGASVKRTRASAKRTSAGTKRAHVASKRPRTVVRARSKRKAR